MAQMIKTLFHGDISRRIEEVIKVDQTDEEILRAEISEYVATDAIREHFIKVLDEYYKTADTPHEGIGVWVSGFFGSGKSSLAKMLGLSIENRILAGIPAGKRFADQVGNNKLQVLLQQISERIPTHAVIFDVSTETGVRSGNQKLTEIAYRLLLGSLGYSRDLDLAELEIDLEQGGRLELFEQRFQQQYGKAWATEKGLVSFAKGQASAVMHALEPETFPSPGSWAELNNGRADITPNGLAERATELMARRRPGKSLLFVIDEVGQFVARDVQKMLDLQAIVQSLGRVGRGKHWIVVTSQEKLDQVVSGLDDKQIELARLMDRFPQQVHLEPSDISEVTSRRVLAKNADAQATLGKLFDEHRARLSEYTRLTADIKLPEVNRQAFIDLYPLLPYQIDLIIQVVSGLRTQGGASKHVGGANRTIIKLAQQVLINPSVDLANAEIGHLARLDQIYDLVEGNIASEIRAKISSIPTTVPDAHTLAQPVAKAICLLQFVKSVHRTPENIAACLYPAVAADSQLAGVKVAIAQLEAAHLVRSGDDGYRIPTPAEDDWERTRAGVNPTPGDEHRLHTEILTGFWQPQPTYTLLGARTFKAGLNVRGRQVVDGEITFQVQLAEDGTRHPSLAQEFRTRSQEERTTVFWTAALSDAIDRETVEVHRSKEVLARKERDARTGQEAGLIAEERLRLKRHQDELRRLLRDALISGNVYFRGNDRSPGQSSSDVSKSVLAVLDVVVPDIYERFKEGAGKPADVKKGLDALLVAENLQGLPSVFTTLALVRSEQGKIVFDLDKGPLHEVFAQIEQRASYGEMATGKFLADEFGTEPYGWDFDVVRLLILALLRAGAIEATNRGQTFDTATGPEAKETFSNNNYFRAASFRPKQGVDFGEIAKANGFSQQTFGTEIAELNATGAATHLRVQVAGHEDALTQARSLLQSDALPGVGVIDTALSAMRSITRGSDDSAILAFNTSYTSIKDGIQRTSELLQFQADSGVEIIRAARSALRDAWAFLETEPDVPEGTRTAATSLEDLLKRETFFRELPAIEQASGLITAEYEGRRARALADRTAAYQAALTDLAAIPGWAGLEEVVRTEITAPLARYASAEVQPQPVSIPLLRSDVDACPGRLQVAIEKALRAIGGSEVIVVSLAPFFAGGIETEDQLEQAIAGIKAECERHIGAGKKIVVK